MSRAITAIAVVTVLAVVVPGASRAADEPVELMAGRRATIRDARVLRAVFRGNFDLPDAANDPRVEGAVLEVFDTGGAAGSKTYVLDAARWRALGRPAGSRGYRYRGRPGDDCRSIVVRNRAVRATCRGNVDFDLPFSGEVGVVLTVGTSSKVYCGSFGGTTARNDATVLRRRNAPAPATCPAPAVPTTTSTTSTTSTTIVTGPCCGGKEFYASTTGIGQGNCGNVVTFEGMEHAEIDCGGLSLGGGQNSVPWPTPVPDFGKTIGKILSCTGQTATVGPTTSVETGTNLFCSSEGCLFGAPLPLPNTASTPTSTCVINSVAVDLSGTIDCGTGTQDVSLPLTSEVFLTGDGQPQTFGLQTCPICAGGQPFVLNSGTCQSGANLGGACTPQSSNQGGLVQYPTSHDCPPALNLSIGSIPIAFALTSGTVSWTATPAANPSSGQQQRVFCGYCRDADITGCFQGDQDIQCPASAPGSVACWENGVAVGGGCTQPFESCQQRNQGAIGPGGNAVTTITVIGSAAGSIVDGLAHRQVLASIFCIPETTSNEINAAADLPGPGAVALDGDMFLCDSANPCP